MTKMAAILKNAHSLKKCSSPELQGQLPWNLLSSIRDCSTAKFICHDPGLTLTYFSARSILIPLAFEWEKLKILIFMMLLYDMVRKWTSSHLNARGQDHLLTFAKVTWVEFFYSIFSIKNNKSKWKYISYEANMGWEK